MSIIAATLHEAAQFGHEFLKRITYSRGFKMRWDGPNNVLRVRQEGVASEKLIPGDNIIEMDFVDDERSAKPARAP